MFLVFVLVRQQILHFQQHNNNKIVDAICDSNQDNEPVFYSQIFDLDWQVNKDEDHFY